jgi:hypothetical protein
MLQHDVIFGGDYIECTFLGTWRVHPCCNIFYYLMGISKAKGKLKGDHSIFGQMAKKTNSFCITFFKPTKSVH